MKKISLILFFISAFSLNQGQAQVTLEQVYDSASVSLYMVNLENDGHKYIRRDLYFNRRLVLYNLDHSIFKIMPLPASIHIYNLGMFGLLYVSQNLFNTDNSIEYMLAYQDSITYAYCTRIIDESGNIIFSSDTLFPIVQANVPQQQVPIYNTSDGTKMILSEMFSGNNIRDAHVFSLGGSLSTAIQPNIFDDELPQLNAFPNPASSEVQLDFSFPPGVYNGDLVLYDMNGSEVRRFRVDNTFNSLLIDASELRPGTYFYQLLTLNGASGTKKMIVISR